MFDTIADNIIGFGPVFAVIWIVTIGCILLRPQRFFNSFLLMTAIMVTILFVSGFMSDTAGDYFLLACFLLVMVALFLVPVLLTVNGIQMLRREGFSLSHVLSLALGVFVGAGEIATVLYVLGLSEFIPFGNNLWTLFAAFTVFYFSFLVLCFVLYSVFIQIMPRRMDFDYVIIHGSGLLGGEKLTPLLQARVDKAIEIYGKCAKKPVVIPSGGQGPDEKISEAQAMKDYLMTRGIPEEHIVPEDASATTEENLINSKAIIDARDGRKKTALVSSNYHIYRCLRLARKLRLKCTGIGAKVALYYWPSALIREFLAVFLTKGFLIWSLLGYLLFVSPVLFALLSK